MDSLVAAMRTHNEYTVIFLYFLLKVSIQPLLPCLGIHHSWHTAFFSRAGWNFRLKSTAIRARGTAPFMEDLNPGVPPSGFQ